MKKGKESDPRRDGEETTEESRTGAAEQEENTEGEPEQEAAEPEESVEQLQEMLQAQKDKYLRLMAEFDNFKRRTAREYERLVEVANERLMLDLVEVRENFQRALSSTEKAADHEGFVKGMGLIFNRLEEILGKHGLRSFGEVGDEFDPALHDAMMTAPNDTVLEGRLAELYERGYRLKEKVIKHAKVIVSAGPPSGGDEAEEETDRENNRDEVSTESES
jgi:molecular chaperone GrpE